MIVYEVNLFVQRAVEAEFRAWLRDHVAEILALPGFVDARVFEREDPPADEGEFALCTHYRLRDADACQRLIAGRRLAVDIGLGDEAIGDETLGAIELGLGEAGPVMAVLPGSRASELRYLAEPFAAAAAWLHRSIPDLRCVVRRRCGRAYPFG